MIIRRPNQRVQRAVRWAVAFTCFATALGSAWGQTPDSSRTLFPSETMRKLTGIAVDEKLAGRDPLEEVGQAAHAKGIRVYAWFEYGFASDYKGGPGSEIICASRTGPHWISPASRSGNTAFIG